LFFALPDQERYARFVESIKEFLALQEIQEEIRRDERPGMIEKRGEIKRRIQNFEDDAPLKVRELYRTAAVPRNGGSLEHIDLGQPAIGNEKLDSWYRKELSDPTRGKILVRPPSDRLIQAKFLSNGDAVSLLTVLEQFHKDPSLPALADTTVLAEAIAGGVRSGSFGIARGIPENPDPHSLQFEEIVSQHAISFNEDTLLLTPERARKLREQLEPEPEPGPEPQPPNPGPQPPMPGPGPIPPLPGPGPSPVDDKVSRIAFRASGIPSSKLIDISRGVFGPLTKEAGEFSFTIEIDVSSADGISKKVIEQQVMETLQQLGARVERRDV